MKHAYISCLGNVYISDDLDCDNEPCDICGDYDRYLGEIETMKDLALLMYEDGFSEDYIIEITGYEVNFEKKFDVEL
ncbi:hypothetical protein [Granulicatella adiacens]|uniref:hypothetical protein n=1 Tax=Granulicatella adiacens TaxID=46124 RepID=UPI002069D4AE|nr:MAG TPA: Zinc-binding domain of primase-helicase [Caudoviricetes sp.]